MVDWLSDYTRDEPGAPRNYERLSVEHLALVSDRSNEGAQFVHGFGGIGGRLKNDFLSDVVVNTLQAPLITRSTNSVGNYLGILRYATDFVDTFDDEAEETRCELVYDY